MKAKLLCLCLLAALLLMAAAAAEGLSQEDITQRVNQFFANGYLEHTEGLSGSLDRQAEGWVATCVSGNTTHQLVLDSRGRVQLYRNLDYDVPATQPDTDAQNVHLMELPWSFNMALDRLLMAQRGYGYNTGYVLAGDPERQIYVYALEVPMTAYAMVRIDGENQLTLLAYGDLNTPMGGYPGYLSRGEALALARGCLVTDGDGKADEATAASASVLDACLVLSATVSDEDGQEHRYDSWMFTLRLDGQCTDIFAEEIQPDFVPEEESDALCVIVELDAATGALYGVWDIDGAANG